MKKKNRRYNRVETEHEHYYKQEFGFDGRERTKEYDGYIKCKLAHTDKISLIVPDMIVLSQNERLRWIQPLCFLANMIIKDNDDIHCNLFIDISFGLTIQIRFKHSDLIKEYGDHSQLFKCKIYSVPNLYAYTTGRAVMDYDDNLFVELYHHTKEDIKKLILKSREFLLSSWNIQGTQRLKNMGFVYLTSLNKIKKNNDLKQIAMASDGEIILLTDDSIQPNKFSEAWNEINKGKTLRMEVYREDTRNRRGNIKLLVDSSTLTPQHIYRHHYWDGGVYYQVCNPFIHRIGVSLDVGKIIFNELSSITRENEVQSFDYIIIGDCMSKEGLQAPFDEENTEHIFKIEKNMNTSILDFWFENANEDHFHVKTIAKLEIL